MNTLKQAESVLQYIEKMVTYFHSNPELGGSEYFTSKKIISELKKEQIEFEIVGNYSIVAYINKNKKRKGIAFRTQIDAQPVKETIDNKVRNISHARGYDAMISVLLGALRILNVNKDKLKGSVIVIFESRGLKQDGPLDIIKSGILQNIDYIFCLSPTFLLPFHKAQVAAKNGLLGSDALEITFSGISKPSSLSHLNSDPILAASSFIENIRKDIAFAISPMELAIVAITQIQAGTYFDISAQSCELVLNIRYLTLETRKKIYELIKKRLENIEETYKVTSELNTSNIFEAMNNNKDAEKIAMDSFIEIDNKNEITDSDTMLLSNSFYHYLKKYKGALCAYGITTNKKDSIYFPFQSLGQVYDISELKIGVAWYLQIAYNHLK